MKSGSRHSHMANLVTSRHHFHLPTQHQNSGSLSSTLTTLSAPSSTIPMASSNSPNADVLNLTELRVALESAGKPTREGAQHPAAQPSSQDDRLQALEDKLDQLLGHVEAFAASVNPYLTALKQQREEAEGGGDRETGAQQDKQLVRDSTSNGKGCAHKRMEESLV